jgi:hypothetical protein
MSTPPRQPGAPKTTSRAAELAAQQVESIVEAAQTSARQLAETATKEVEAARQEAEQVRVLARESARADLEAARKEAAERIAEAQAAADDVLAEAKAVSGGMRQLAHLLTTHAERILRDVTNSHRAISADLRAAVTADAPPPAADEEAAPDEPAPRPRRTARRERGAPRAISAIENPFDEIEPPSWVEEPQGKTR